MDDELGQGGSSAHLAGAARELMGKNLDIHPDFQSIKGRALTLGRSRLAMMNGILTAVNAIRRRRFRTIISREKITGTDGQRIPLLIVTPEKLHSPSAALVYCHGGAFIMKHAPQHIDNAVRYAREANCRVIFVDYRLAPRYPFPAGFDDCYAALLVADTRGSIPPCPGIYRDSGIRSLARRRQRLRTGAARQCSRSVVDPEQGCGARLRSAGSR
jgi:alpha/beta hydrolase fold